MATKKKRPSKKAKAAQRILKDSELLANVNSSRESNAGSEFKPDSSAPKPTAAIKPRPDKKRG